jgi:WhiB family redox-sensing transcriptional regulator
MSLADELQAESLMLDEDVDHLADLIHRPAWMADAACREHPEVDFFPGRGGDFRAARAVCSTCLVREPCLEMALSYPSNECHGIWAGTSSHDRRVLLRTSGEPRPVAMKQRQPIICRECGIEVEQPARGRRRRVCVDCRPWRSGLHVA